jgi:hypothetical protein
LLVGLVIGAIIFRYASSFLPDQLAQRTRVCVRRFAFGPAGYLFPPRHCYMQFNDGSTLSFDPQGVHTDPAPDTLFRSCFRIFNITVGTCQERCIRENMFRCSGSQYRFFRYNCCDCVRSALEDCRCDVPLGVRTANLGF